MYEKEEESLAPGEICYFHVSLNIVLSDHSQGFQV